MQNTHECYLTGATVELHKHHIFHGTALRKISENNGFWVWLRWDWHNGAKYGVHFNRDLDLRLKRECQEKFEETNSREEFMKIIGKNYL
jgi:hypothetical protein